VTSFLVASTGMAHTGMAHPGAALVGAVVDPGPLDLQHLGHVRFDPVTVLVVVAGVLYALGVRRFGQLHPGRPWSVRRTVAFFAGLVASVAALDSFIGVYDTVLFYDHMIQHLLLIMVAAPLLAMGAPVDLLARATTGPTHRVVEAGLGSKVAEVVAHPIVDFLLYAVLIPVAHLTSFYNDAVTSPAVNSLEHLAFLVVGYLFWRHVVAIEPSRHPLIPPIRLVFLALAVPVDTFTGLTLASTSHPLFPALVAEHRSWGPSPLTDLHMGGAIMWVGGDTLMLLGMIPCAVLWMRFEERRAAEIDRQLDLGIPMDRVTDGAPPGSE
jgi:cytochrome c oxidase assembly factor CtaG